MPKKSIKKLYSDTVNKIAWNQHMEFYYEEQGRVFERKRCSSESEIYREELNKELADPNVEVDIENTELGVELDDTNIKNKAKIKMYLYLNKLYTEKYGKDINGLKEFFQKASNNLEDDMTKKLIQQKAIESAVFSLKITNFNALTGLYNEGFNTFDKVDDKELVLGLKIGNNVLENEKREESNLYLGKTAIYKYRDESKGYINSINKKLKESEEYSEVEKDFIMTYRKFETIKGFLGKIYTDLLKTDSFFHNNTEEYKDVLEAIENIINNESTNSKEELNNKMEELSKAAYSYLKDKVEDRESAQGEIRFDGIMDALNIVDSRKCESLMNTLNESRLQNNLPKKLFLTKGESEPKNVFNDIRRGLLFYRRELKLYASTYKNSETYKAVSRAIDKALEAGDDKLLGCLQQVKESADAYIQLRQAGEVDETTGNKLRICEEIKKNIGSISNTYLKKVEKNITKDNGVEEKDKSVSQVLDALVLMGNDKKQIDKIKKLYGIDENNAKSEVYKDYIDYAENDDRLRALIAAMEVVKSDYLDKKFEEGSFIKQFIKNPDEVIKNLQESQGLKKLFENGEGSYSKEAANNFMNNNSISNAKSLKDNCGILGKYVFAAGSINSLHKVEQKPSETMNYNSLVKEENKEVKTNDSIQSFNNALHSAIQQKLFFENHNQPELADMMEKNIQKMSQAPIDNGTSKKNNENIL